MESQPAGYPVRSLPCHTHWRRHHLLIDRPHIITHGWRLSLVTQLAWFGLRTCMTLGPWGDDIRLVWGMLHSIPIPTLFPSYGNHSYGNCLYTYRMGTTAGGWYHAVLTIVSLPLFIFLQSTWHVAHSLYGCCHWAADPPRRVGEGWGGSP